MIYDYTSWRIEGPVLMQYKDLTDEDPHAQTVVASVKAIVDFPVIFLAVPDEITLTFGLDS